MKYKLIKNHKNSLIGSFNMKWLFIDVIMVLSLSIFSCGQSEQNSSIFN